MNPDRSKVCKGFDEMSNFCNCNGFGIEIELIEFKLQYKFTSEVAQVKSRFVISLELQLSF